MEVSGGAIASAEVNDHDKQGEIAVLLGIRNQFVEWQLFKYEIAQAIIQRLKGEMEGFGESL